MFTHSHFLGLSLVLWVKNERRGHIASHRDSPAVVTNSSGGLSLLTCEHNSKINFLASGREEERGVASGCPSITLSSNRCLARRRPISNDSRRTRSARLGDNEISRRQFEDRQTGGRPDYKRVQASYCQEEEEEEKEEERVVSQSHLPLFRYKGWKQVSKSSWQWTKTVRGPSVSGKHRASWGALLWSVSSASLRKNPVSHRCSWRYRRDLCETFRLRINSVKTEQRSSVHTHYATHCAE